MEGLAAETGVIDGRVEQRALLLVQLPAAPLAPGDRDGECPLTARFDEITLSGAELWIEWERTRLVIPIVLTEKN